MNLFSLYQLRRSVPDDRYRNQWSYPRGVGISSSSRYTSTLRRRHQHYSVYARAPVPCARSSTCCDYAPHPFTYRLHPHHHSGAIITSPYWHWRSAVGAEPTLTPNMAPALRRRRHLHIAHDGALVLRTQRVASALRRRRNSHDGHIHALVVRIMQVCGQSSVGSPPTSPTFA